jgi:hypothetical protein
VNFIFLALDLLLCLPLPLTPSLQGRENHSFIPSPLGEVGGQASSEDLFPLGYGEWDRVRVRVKIVKS